MKKTIPRWVRATSLTLFLGYQAVSTPAMFAGCPLLEPDSYNPENSLPSRQDIETAVLRDYCADHPCSDSYQISIAESGDIIYGGGKVERSVTAIVRLQNGESETYTVTSLDGVVQSSRRE